MSNSQVQSQITKAKKFNPDDVTYKPPVVNKRGGKSVMCQLNGHPIVLQFPLMLTWGVNERVDETSGRVSYDMALQFGGDSASAQKFEDALKKFQEKVLDDAVEKREWLGKKMSKEVAKAMMYPILKYPKMKDGSGEPDYSRSPTLKLKLPYWEGKFYIELYDMDRQPLYLPSNSGSSDGPQGTKMPGDLIPKASHVKGLLACTGLWFAGGRFGVTWKLVQANVRPPLRLVGTGTCHILDDSDDEEALDALNKRETPKTEEVEQDAVGPSFDSSSDDDVDEEEEEEAKPDTPAPELKKKKKVVRRKKKVSAN